MKKKVVAMALRMLVIDMDLPPAQLPMNSEKYFKHLAEDFIFYYKENK